MEKILRKRPRVLSILVGADFVIVLVSMGFIMMPSIRRLGDWMPAFYGFLIALEFISLIGVWHMKRWGVWLFTGVFFAQTIFFMLIDHLNMMGTFYSFVLLVLFIAYYRRMSRDL